jgi:uncharacterized protein YdiU (UPF0061 family)
MPSPQQPCAPLKINLQWDNSFAALGEAFFVPWNPTPLRSPYWVGRSASAAQAAGLTLDWLESPEMLNALTGNCAIEGSHMLASVYSGHQFGVWAGQLGDGRAILLGETAGQEIQLKGAGKTPFSRMGDGRAVLRSSIREFLCSEAMHGLHIPTSRALCVTGSDDSVQRETLETAAVLTRMAPSFIRFGHFEHFCQHDQHSELRALADYVIERFYPQCRTAAIPGATRPTDRVYAAFLREVTARTASMVAQWQAVGFCHGVMNTDNMSILGLTIDYGPFQFLDQYDPGHICNHSDHQGRYAFQRQPQVAYWNLYCLGQALMPLIESQELAIAALETFKTDFDAALDNCMAAKLGFGAVHKGQRELVNTLLELLHADRVDYTIFWRRLSQWVKTREIEPTTFDATVRDLFIDTRGIDQWLLQYSEHTKLIPRGLSADLMLASNPKFVLRNHLGELAIRAAKSKDFSLLAQLLQVLERPFDEHPDFEDFAAFPPDWAGGIEISCSS